MPPLPDPKALRERKACVGRLNLHLRLWGDPSKPLVLLQHGGKDHGWSWDWTVAALLDEYCVAVPDLRGHGDSDWPTGGGYDTFDFVTDMAGVVEALIAEGFAGPFDLIGHSLGGNIVLHYAASHPNRVRRIISLEGLGFSDKSYADMSAAPLQERMSKAVGRRLKVASREQRFFAEQEEGIKRLRHLHSQLSDQQAEHLAVHALAQGEGGWRWKHDPHLGMLPIRPMPPAEYLPVYASIAAPVLLMYGRDSGAPSPKGDGRVEAFQNAQLIEYEAAGHWLHHDRFDDFIRDVRAFLGKPS